MVAVALALAVNVPATLLLIVRWHVLLFVAASKAAHVVVPGVLGAGDTLMVKSAIDTGDPPFGIAVITAVNVCDTPTSFVAVLGPIVMNASGLMFTNAVATVTLVVVVDRSADSVSGSRRYPAGAVVSLMVYFPRINPPTSNSPAVPSRSDGGAFVLSVPDTLSVTSKPNMVDPPKRKTCRVSAPVLMCRSGTDLLRKPVEFTYFPWKSFNLKSAHGAYSNELLSITSSTISSFLAVEPGLIRLWFFSSLSL